MDVMGRTLHGARSGHREQHFQMTDAQGRMT